MAKWIKSTGMMAPEMRGSYYCNKCGNLALRDWIKIGKYTVLSNYCPNCGEPMENSSKYFAEELERMGGIV